MEGKAAVGARCGGGVKTPPYEWKIKWREPGGAKGKLSGRGKVRRRGQDPSLRREDSMAAAVRWRAGHARPLQSGEKGNVSGRGNGGRGSKGTKRLIIQ